MKFEYKSCHTHAILVVCVLFVPNEYDCEGRRYIQYLISQYSFIM